MKAEYFLTYIDTEGKLCTHSIFAWCDKPAVDEAYAFVAHNKDITHPQLTDPDNNILLRADEIWW